MLGAEQISKKGVFVKDFGIMRVIFPGRKLIALPKYRYLRRCASFMIFFVMRVYKSVKNGSSQKEF